MRALKDQLSRYRILPAYIALAAFILGAVWLGSLVPNADWFATFDPAVRGIFQGRSPYDLPSFLNPPWAVLILLPFVLFPPALARGLVLVCTLVALIYAAWRMHAPKIAVIALLISPTVIGCLLAANLDAFVLLGIFLPPTWGLMVLMIKPQIGIGVAFYTFVDAWRNHKIFGLFRIFGPLLIAYLAGGFLFPIWIS